MPRIIDGASAGIRAGTIVREWNVAVSVHRADAPERRVLRARNGPLTVIRVCGLSGSLGSAQAGALLEVVVDDAGLGFILGLTPHLIAAVDARGDEASIG